jgi:hypothetical protein
LSHGDADVESPVPKAAPRARAVLPTHGNPTSQKAVAFADITTFGDALVRTNDLDPSYVAIYGADLPLPQQKRLLLALVLFYHTGVAAKLSEYEDQEFWDQMLVAAANDDRWPRGRERRHFRGKKCVEAVETLSRLASSPEALIDSLIAPVPGSIALSADVVMARAKKLPQWGPWAAFKFADLAERLGLAAIEFPDNLPLYKDPKAALARLGGEPALRRLLNHFAAFPAPPRFERPCNIQEVESIICKFGHGSYVVGKDIKQIRRDLIGFGETAEKLLQHMPADDHHADHHHKPAAVASKISLIKPLDPNVTYGDEDNRGSVPAVSTAPSEAIYVEAVAEINNILARHGRDWWRVGELADQVEKVYDENRLKQFADDTGIALGRLERCRSVFRAWRTKKAPAPILSFSVAQELQSHPDRFELIEKNPHLSKTEARKKMHRLRKKQKKNLGFERKELTKTLAALAAAAKTAQRLELKPVNLRLLKELATKYPDFAADQGAGGDALHRNRDLINQLDDLIAAGGNQEDDAVEAARRRLAQQRQALKQSDRQADSAVDAAA